jgi:hypothetical protein
VLIFKQDDIYNIRNNIAKSSKITDYFVSYLIYRLDTGVLTEYKTIQNYDPSTGVVILNRMIMDLSYLVIYLLSG